MNAPLRREVALQQLLLRAAAQVRVLSDRTLSLEDAVGAAVSGGLNFGPLGERLQDLDGLVQALTGMADYIDGLANDIDPTMLIDPTAALTRVRQRDLVNGLLGDDGTVHADQGTADFF